MTIENLKTITRFIKLQEIANLSKLKYSTLYTKMMRGTELNVKESDALTYAINKILADVTKNVK
ncbi:MAG TPA: hypothetical protein PKX51_18145 [Cyclobacteriaceae bacterium]|nr:hypothetical protein [Cyclobacteriaceae bacterium]HND44248.1 hypothetical protein [Cyclobacteriaceae bacterium]